MRNAGRELAWLAAADPTSAANDAGRALIGPLAALLAPDVGTDVASASADAMAEARLGLRTHLVAPPPVFSLYTGHKFRIWRK